MTSSDALYHFAADRHVTDGWLIFCVVIVIGAGVGALYLYRLMQRASSPGLQLVWLLCALGAVVAAGSGFMVWQTGRVLEPVTVYADGIDTHWGRIPAGDIRNYGIYQSQMPLGLLPDGAKDTTRYLAIITYGGATYQFSSQNYDIAGMLAAIEKIKKEPAETEQSKSGEQ